MIVSWEYPELNLLIETVIGGDWGKAPDHNDPDLVDVLCIRGTELRHWHSERGASAAPRKIKKASLAKRALNAGDIVLEVSGGGPEQPVGRVELIDRQSLSQGSEVPRVCTNFFRRLVVIKGIEPAFVVWFLKFFYSTGKIREYQAGSNNLRNLTYSKYETIRIPVAPLNEQHRIVERIETLFARLDKGEEAVRAVQKSLTRYRQSVLKAAVTGELTADWRAEREGQLEHGSDLLARILKERREKWEGRGKYKEPVEPDTKDLPELPEGWVWASVEQIAKIMGGLTKNSKRKEMALSRPMLRVANVYQNRLKLDEIHQSGVTEGELARVLLESRDILVVEGNGSKDQIGRMAVWSAEIPDAVHQNHLIKIRLFEKSLAEFLITWFQSLLGRQVVENVASSTSGLYTLSISKIASMVVPLPSVKEVSQIIEEVEEAQSKITVLEEWCETELKRSAALRQSILKDAFSGKLVEQDPNDEPASVLLARIKKNKETA